MSSWASLSRLLVALLLLPAAAGGQVEAEPTLRGQVTVGDEPLTQGTVILHQVSSESSGEIDSVQVARDGTFQIRLPHVPDHVNRPEIFFASVEYRGLLYFGPAVTEAIQLDSLYRIRAYDTLSVPVGGAELPLASRNLFLERTADGWTATDVFQLVNNGDRTLYSPEEGVVWSYPLPSSASDFQVGQGDMAPDAVGFVDNRLEVSSPLPPGERFLMIRYRLAGAEFVLPMPGETRQIAILLREPAPPAEFPPLSPSTPVELEPGNTFRRYAGENLLDTEIRSHVAPEPWSLSAEWVALVLAGLLGAAGVIAYRFRQGAGPTQAGPIRKDPEKISSREQTLLAIATLDEEFQALPDPSEEDLVRYRAQRSRLLARLQSRS